MGHLHNMSMGEKKELGGCVGCRCQGVGNRGLQKRSWAALCWTQVVPDAFKMQAPQDTAESVSQASPTGMKAYLREENTTGKEGNKKE